ncbi:MAG: hypothetical protein VZR09_07205 [Candidatus Gastranaerophilaceae bacterium]|nr:hypothetical protein [Candidatus Gastranaerophilaceae bacterium]
MNLSVQNHIMNNTNYTSIQKTSFKGKFLTPKAFAAEAEVIERINTLPKNVFLECSKFTKFCKSIDITPKINRALKNRLVEVRQTKVGSKSFIG